MRTANGIVLAFVAILLFGCQDPLTKQMDKLGFVPLIPAPEKAAIGDIYQTVNIAHDNDPYALMRRLVPDYSEKLMRDSENPVDLPSFSGEKIYDLKADANFVGRLTAELTAKSVTKYSITFVGAKQYILDHHTWETETLPKLRKVDPNLRTDGKFLLRGLLWVESLEYTFYQNNGGKFNVKADPDLSKAVQAELGAGWTITDQGTLTIKPNAPKFIGYKIGVIKGDIFYPATFIAIPPYTVVDVKASTIRNQMR